MFPGWKRETIRRIIRNCVKNDLLIVSNFNTKKYDRTCWFTLTDKGLEYYPVLKLIMSQIPDNPGGVSLVGSNIPLVGSNPPIPTLLPSSSNNTITTSGSSNSKVNELLQKLIQVYREEFPDNPQPHKTLISTSLDKALRGLIKRWPEADPNKKPITVEGFRRYMQSLKEMSPKFSLGEYITQNGSKKKNGLETFCRWNTFVKFLENQYS